MKSSKPLSLEAMQEVRDKVRDVLRLAVEEKASMEDIRFLTGIWTGFSWCVNPGCTVAQEGDKRLAELLGLRSLESRKDQFRDILRRMGGLPGEDE